MSKQIENLIGRQFTRLLVIQFSGKNSHRQTMWLCRCQCGNEVIIRGDGLKSGHTRSCGCLQKDATREICRSLGKANAIAPGQAVLNTKLLSYKKSAASRGYSWNLTKSEAQHMFLQDCYFCGSKPSEMKIKHYSTVAFVNGIDRVDNSLGYEPTNCVPCCKKCQFNKKECSMSIAKKMVEFEQRKESK